MSRLYRALGGVVLARLRGYLTIRLETGETRKVQSTCQVKIGGKVHVFIDRVTNVIIKVRTEDVPSDSVMEEPPMKEKVSTYMIDAPPTWEESLNDREVLGRQGDEETRSQEFQESQEVLGRPRSEGESMWIDSSEQYNLTQIGENPITNLGDLT